MMRSRHKFARWTCGQDNHSVICSPDMRTGHLEKSARSGAPIKNRRLYRQLQNIDKLPKRDQQALLRTIDAFLAKAS